MKESLCPDRKFPQAEMLSNANLMRVVTGIKTNEMVVDAVVFGGF